MTRYKEHCQKGFTLAEVLITLGIIGVVAAMTIPALTANSRKQEVIARLKKVNSIMQQAILLSVNDNGPMEYWNKVDNSITTGEDGTPTYDHINGSKQSYEFFMKYFAPYMKYTKIEEMTNCPFDTSQKRTQVTLADGTVMCVKNGSCIDFDIDINGNKKPNKAGLDRFYYVFCPTKVKEYFNKSGFGPYRGSFTLETWNDRDKLLETCAAGNGSSACARLIEFDGWEIKDDYPLHI